VTDSPDVDVRERVLPYATLQGVTCHLYSRRASAVENAIQAKLAPLQNPPAPPLRAAAPGANLGAAGISKALTEPPPGANLGAPAINTGLTSEQRRALMFRVA